MHMAANLDVLNNPEQLSEYQWVSLRNPIVSSIHISKSSNYLIGINRLIGGKNNTLAIDECSDGIISLIEDSLNDYAQK